MFILTNMFIRPHNKFIRPPNKFIRPPNKFIRPLNKFIRPPNKFIRPPDKFKTLYKRNKVFKKVKNCGVITEDTSLYVEV